jgi:uncharacterized protein YidB (DUF937 family)
MEKVPMGLLSSLIQNPQMISNIAKFASENPQISKAAMSLLSSQDSSVGGGAGLGGILESLNSKGLGDVVSSWLGSGDNKAIAPDQVKEALGSDAVAQFAQKAGIESVGDASTVLAGMLPGLVDKLSPDGKIPETSGLDGLVGGILGALAGKS